MLYLGIDGGGTKTRGVLSDAAGCILADRTVGPSNPNDITPEGTVQVISALVRALFADADPTAPVALFAGISGALNHRELLTEALQASVADTPVCTVDIGSDVQILLTAEIPEGDGACVICGTGSACFLRRGDEIIRIGGWGYLLDSAGGGYSIGRDALEAALMAHDGRGMPTSLSRRLADFYGAPAETLITDIYREGKPYIASAAPCVFAAAEEDSDPVATRILERNARALADCIEAALHHLLRSDAPPPPSLPVVMGGGISQKCPDFVNLVISHIPTELPISVTVASAPPVMGALLEAASGAGKGSTRPPLSHLHGRWRAALGSHQPPRP